MEQQGQWVSQEEESCLTRPIPVLGNLLPNSASDGKGDFDLFEERWEQEKGRYEQKQGCDFMESFLSPYTVNFKAFQTVCLFTPSYFSLKLFLGALWPHSSLVELNLQNAKGLKSCLTKLCLRIS